MKKLAIAGASVALAAMPVVGVFADASEVSSFKDQITLTITSTCKLEADVTDHGTGEEHDYYNTVNLGTSTVAHEFNGSGTGVAGTPMTVTCNDQQGWSIQATATALSASGTNQTIPFGAYSVSGESVWSAKIALSGSDTTNAAITQNWDNWAATTASSTDIVAATGQSGQKTGVSGLVVTPSYKAYGSAHQAAGTYSGTMTYTFTGAAHN